MLQAFSYSSLESGRSADESSVLVVGDSGSHYGTGAIELAPASPRSGTFRYRSPRGNDNGGPVHFHAWT